MDNFRSLLPSYRGLVAFEAAGRLGSFTKAGDELGVSQAAISYSIKALEEDVGQSLFERAHRTVRLTEAGRRLHKDVAQGLAQMVRGLMAVRTKPADNLVTLSTSAAFATLWIAPRLQAMRSDLPDIEIRLHTSDRDLDLVTENLPLGIRVGRLDDWPAYEGKAFTKEEIIAVASPDYLKSREPLESEWDLVDHHLAHLDEPYRHATTWPEWLRTAGVVAKNLPGGFRANDYVAVLQTALDGDAIALGWLHLVDIFLKNGRLVEVTDHRMKTGMDVCVVWPKNRTLSPGCEAVRDWIVNQY